MTVNLFGGKQHETHEAPEETHTETTKRHMKGEARRDTKHNKTRSGNWDLEALTAVTCKHAKVRYSSP